MAILAPFECVVCGTEGSLLCKKCALALEKVPRRCYRCRKLANGFRTCTVCRRASKLYSVRPATVYRGAAKTLVGRLKFYGARAAASEIAYLMSSEGFSKKCVVIPVPTATSRVRQRGYDQAKLIAREFSKHTGLPYLDCLARSGQSHQVGSGRTQRIKQLKSSYRVKTSVSIQGLQVVLIDDVLTTGATLEAAAICLKNSGVKRIQACIFAQA